MKRLMDAMVRSGLVIACRLAGSPILRSPLSIKATTEGVVRFPSSFGITTGSFPSITATQELVVPRSMPIILPIVVPFIVGKKFVCFLYSPNKGCAST